MTAFNDVVMSCTGPCQLLCGALVGTDWQIGIHMSTRYGKYLPCVVCNDDML